MATFHPVLICLGMERLYCSFLILSMSHYLPETLVGAGWPGRLEWMGSGGPT